MNATSTNKTAFRNLLGLFFILLMANVSASANDMVGASAKLSKDRSLSIAARGLSNKLRADLVLQDVKVRLEKAEQYYVSKTQIGVRGEGKCEFSGDANPLPINFDVKIDVNRQNVSDVKYIFLDGNDANGEPIMPTVEDFATRSLLEKLQEDFETLNVVVALDSVNAEEAGNGVKKMTGAGEARVGGFEWKKVTFEMTEREGKIWVKYQIK